MADPTVIALARCNPNEALEPGDSRFVDFDDLRGLTLRTRIRKFINAAEQRDGFVKVVVAGHRGSGKSTELNRVQKDLESLGYVVLWASVRDNLDPADVSFSDVLRLIIQLLDFGFGEQSKQDLDVARAFDSVREWFREVTVSHEKQLDDAREFGLRGGLGGKLAAEAGAEADAGVGKGGLKFKTDLGELAASINIVRRSQSTERVAIRETLERYQNQLVDNVNLLLRAIGAAKLVVVLDNVDKYESKIVNEAFLRNAELYQQLDCHLVFTIQSSMRYQPVEDAVEEGFSVLEIPMLPVFERGTRTAAGAVVSRLREAVYLRVPAELFGADASVDELILASGGCWRDLLRLLEEALLSADSQITARDILRAKQNVARTFRRILRDQDDLQVLARAHIEHRMMADERSCFLLHHRCILSYNGEGWYDIHPLLDA